MQPISKQRWHRFRLNLQRVKHSFRIVFNAFQLSEASHTYYAIGNIQLNSCSPRRPSLDSCPVAWNHFWCANKVCIDSSFVCDFEDDCDDGTDEINCDQSRMMSFESGFGRWGNGIKKNWDIRSAKQFTSLQYGPTYDHTTGKYFSFMFLKSYFK